MEPSPKPVHRSGNRNINCPFYGNCLDQAVKQNWQAWDCYECAYKSKHQVIPLTNSDYDFDHYYILPQSVARQVQ